MRSRPTFGAAAALLVSTAPLPARAFAPPQPRPSISQRTNAAAADPIVINARKASPPRTVHLAAADGNRSPNDSPNDGTAGIDDSGGGGFESLGLTNELTSVAQKMGWEAPTPVQRLAIPSILDMATEEEGDEAAGDEGEGRTTRSLWCEGPTGSGKTGGFVLPLLQILTEQKRRRGTTDQPRQDGHVAALILSPTRELAAQTGSVLQRLASYLPKSKRSGDISIDVIHGGVPSEAQVARLAKRRRDGTGLDILVATPGRLVDVLRYSDSGDDPTLAALERRIMDAFDDKSAAGDGENNGGRKRKKGKGRRGPPPKASSLTLQDIQDMDLDRVDADGRDTLDQMLRSLEYLVVDEADRLLGGAFREEVDGLLSLLPKAEESELKTLLFSATFPEQIEERVDRVLARLSAGTPLRVSTSASMLQRVPLVDGGEDEGNEDTDGSFADDVQLSNRQRKHLAHTTPITNVLPDHAPNIHHRVIRLDERDRTQALRHLLDQHSEDEWDRVLVFVGTRYASEHVARKLRRYDISAAELHGKLDQDARERRLKAFRSGRTRVLVTTDLSARGIDVEGLPVVVNYDLPRAAADFTHRTGRTGRAGRSGAAITFLSAKSEAHFDLIERKELRGRNNRGRIAREVLPEFAPDEARWEIAAAAATSSVPGAAHSVRGLEHDKMFGGVKGRRKSKKDKLREEAAAAAKAKAPREE